MTEIVTEKVQLNSELEDQFQNYCRYFYPNLILRIIISFTSRWAVHTTGGYIIRNSFSLALQQNVASNTADKEVFILVAVMLTCYDVNNMTMVVIEE